MKPPPDLAVILLAVPSMGDVMEVFGMFRDELELTAYEFFSDNALRHVLARHDLAAPFGRQSEYYVLIEFEQREPRAMEDALSAFQTCVDRGIALDGVVSQSDGQREDLWKFREFISESISEYTPYKNDVSVRISRVAAFLSAVENKVAERYPDFEVVWFGHIGDGNLHLNVLKPEAWSVDDFRRECERVSEEVLAIVAGFEGSISAEHGVGLLKRGQLGFSRTPEEIELMRGLKDTFDPNGIMNPGKLLVGSD